MIENEEEVLNSEKKAFFIAKMKITFSQIRELMELTELNIVSEDIEVEAHYFALATNFIIFLHDFLEEMQPLIRFPSH
jgi:hypothetical protein